MKSINKINIFSLFLVLSILTTILITPALSAPSKYTLESRSTWNSDMVNKEQVTETGNGVYIAVLDTGLAPNWRDFFPKDRIATKLGKGFYQPIHVDPRTGLLVVQENIVESTWKGSSEDTHGTMVASVILGYNYDAPTDDYELTFPPSSYPLPPIHVEGIAPDATVIPIKVETTYHLPPYTGPGTMYPYGYTTGTDLAIAAGIRYATDLKLKGYSPMIISMSLGGPASTILEDAIDYAIDNGVIVVASAGNEGSAGMGYPGAYSQVISVGACGWQYEWLHPTEEGVYRLWWLQDTTYGYVDVSDPTSASEVYITYWSSRELAGQELDVVAPGSWIRGPFTWSQGYNHIPWWAKGEPPWTHIEGISKSKNFWYVGGTSFSAPTVSAIVALMLEKNPDLTQNQVETILKSTALTIPPGSMTVFDLYDWTTGAFYPDDYTYTWGSDATGYGLVQADSALTNTPPIP
jgi:hypothetical protein